MTRVARGPVGPRSAPQTRLAAEPSRREALKDLAARAHEHLVDADVRRLADRVEDRGGDVLRAEPLDVGEALANLLEDLRTVVARELGGNGAGLDQRHAHAESDPL